MWGSSQGSVVCSLQGNEAHMLGRWVSSWVTWLHLKEKTKPFKDREKLLECLRDSLLGHYNFPFI